jgi:hypothetical protein
MHRIGNKNLHYIDAQQYRGHSKDNRRFSQNSSIGHDYTPANQNSMFEEIADSIDLVN